MSIARLIEGHKQDIIQCSPGDLVHHAASLLAEKRIGALPVTQDSRVVGIFSERDLLYCIAREGADVLQRPVSDVMTSPAITIGPDCDVLKALSLMTKRRIRHLPVVDGDALLAFVSIGDLVKYRMGIIEAEAEQMREYISMA
ncbi:CBS domain-containing protein [Alteraurantiacibacter aestuarii]|uniref:CBS domain-containing protein n=1 Tax=Alteraurantiacibacter aestuarii TaxID=650004 RepID=A0A844ZP40_9SPHN|nr:CBS domain-containing protein [Alteraurantiacibacter aestuarii]MXO88587.1 CBS domain-containing protein [Alteraurantiacibacter aestuarii]